MEKPTIWGLLCYNQYMDKEERKRTKVQKRNEIKNASQIFSKNLREILKQNRITQQELAIAMGINDQTISNWFDSKKGYQPCWIGYMTLMFKHLVETEKIKFFDLFYLYKGIIKDYNYDSLEEIYKLKFVVEFWEKLFGKSHNKIILYLMQDRSFNYLISNLTKLTSDNNEKQISKTDFSLREKFTKIGEKLYDIIATFKKNGFNGKINISPYLPMQD